MTLQDMYDAYVKDVVEPVSISTYRRTFLTKFNLKFKALKKDTCNACDVYAAKVQTVNSEEGKQKLLKEHNEHIDLAKEAQTLMRSDMEKANKEHFIECLTFDMEKTLPLPRIPTNVMFYKRQL